MQSNLMSMQKKKPKIMLKKLGKNMKMISKLKIKNQKPLTITCKRSLSVLAISMCVLMMMGCQQSIPLVIPSNLAMPCPDLKKLESGRAKDIALTMVDDRRKYIDCQQRHAAVISIVKPSK